MTTREKALEYIDRCTQRQGFVILADGVRDTMADAFCLGYDDNSEELGIRDRGNYYIINNKAIEPFSLSDMGRVQLIDLYEAGYITRHKELADVL